MPMPKPVASISRPRAFVYSALPSASICTLPSHPCDLPQAFITNGSLTAIQAIVSTPLARISSARSTNPGRCFASHVGVKAPGTEKRTTFLPLKKSSALIFCGPSFVASVRVPDGILSPTLMGMLDPPDDVACRRVRRRVTQDAARATCNDRKRRSFGIATEASYPTPYTLHSTRGAWARECTPIDASESAQRSACTEDVRTHQSGAPFAVMCFQGAHDLKMMRCASNQVLILIRLKGSHHERGFDQ